MKALLINPPTGVFVREDRCQSAVSTFALPVIRPPMDLMMMAASLEETGMACKIKDYPIEGGGWGAVKSDLAGFKPDFLIIGSTTSTIQDDLQSCVLAKSCDKGMVTIIKGADLFISAAETLNKCKELDIVITGECELTVKEIVTKREALDLVAGIAHRNGDVIASNLVRESVQDLDSLPLPARHLINNALYTRLDTGEPMAIIEVSRGCPFNCIFCLAGKTYGHKVRYRSVKSVVKEIGECKKNYGISNFHLKSDLFTWDRQWVMELCQGLIDSNVGARWLCNSRVDTLDAGRLKIMKDAGCWAISLGVESGSQDILDKMGKGITLEQSRQAVALCRAAGIKTYLYFLIGFPWDTEKTIHESIRFAKELDGDFADFFIVYPFRGTALEKIAREYNLLGDYDHFKNAYSDIAMDTLSVPRQRLAYLRKKGLVSFYLRPGYIARTLARAASWTVRANYIKYGLRLLKSIS